ncbi:MAG: hypothetical protein F6K11_06260 [Leptolyngbya sp. SIO3F4]|nr:hypothetical protein [Leptolyngbya sp. SIO3F4]
MKGSRFLEKANDPGQSWVMYFLVGVLGLGILGNGVANLILEDLASWLAQQIGLSKLVIQLVMVAVITTLIILGIYLSKLDERMQALLSARVQSQTNVTPLTETYWGLITIASIPRPDKTTPAEEAFQFHWQQGQGKLRYCWLICTEDVFDPTRDRLQSLVSQSLQTKVPITLIDNPDVALVPTWEIGPKLQLQLIPVDRFSANDPNYMRQLVERIYDQAKALSVDSQEVIADYTGGTKSMTAGVVLACSTPERHLQYISGRYNAQNELQGFEVMKVNLSYRLKLAKD